jgi:hypothetical protein
VINISGDSLAGNTWHEDGCSVTTDANECMSSTAPFCVLFRYERESRNTIAGN